ncbi:coiled-coil domain-containing protein 57 [Microcaecilia unicolor]|uniref:Coiled-coil domain-containing protein 57-like n=1 Tax=Microcaecilia unicolor TaxID=1415580 RepID=A0A6P7Y7W4_9AMPH|nr:coiled-coil domain-containing protein 57-like [Microcaecilia unicolor]
METMVSALTFERDQRMQMPQKHEVLPRRGKQAISYDSQTMIESEFQSSEIHKLQEENTGLKAVIAEMRKEMEALCNDSTSTQQQIPAPGTFTSGALHTDKVCPAYDSKKLESRPIVTQLICKANIEQLQSELTSQIQQSHSEVSGLHKQMTDLELQLRKSRREEKGNLQENLNVIAPGNEQLQDILTRQPLDGCGGGDGPHQSLGCSFHVLHGKLKEAMRKISRLTQEKQQLIELGNRLRAELGSTGSGGLNPSNNSPEPTVHSSALHPKELVQKAQSRLFALEQLQYQLTKQELQYAQQQSPPGLKNCGSITECKIEENIRENQIPRIQTWQKSPMITSDPEFKQSQQSVSSCLEDVTLQDMWQILDMGSSPSVSSTQDEILQVNPQTARTWRSLSKSTTARQELKSPFTVEGTKVEVQQKSKFHKPSHAYSTKITNSQQMGKNLKDRLMSSLFDRRLQQCTHCSVCPLAWEASRIQHLETLRRHALQASTNCGVFN